MDGPEDSLNSAHQNSASGMLSRSGRDCSDPFQEFFDGFWHFFDNKVYDSVASLMDCGSTWAKTSTRTYEGGRYRPFTASMYHTPITPKVWGTYPRGPTTQIVFNEGPKYRYVNPFGPKSSVI